MTSCSMIENEASSGPYCLADGLFEEGCSSNPQPKGSGRGGLYKGVVSKALMAHFHLSQGYTKNTQDKPFQEE